MCYPVCGMVHIIKTLLLIKKSSPCIITHRLAHTMASYTSRVILAGIRKSSMGPTMRDRFDKHLDF